MSAQNDCIRILIVEGYLGNAKSLSSHLGGFAVPLEITPVQDGRTALMLLQRHAFDLLIIDACLKGRMDGYELCRAIRDSLGLSELPVIMLLAGHLILERSRGIAAGADVLVQRPVLTEELCKMVRLLLEWKSNGAIKVQPHRDEGRGPRRLRPVG